MSKRQIMITGLKLIAVKILKGYVLSINQVPMKLWSPPEQCLVNHVNDEIVLCSKVRRKKGEGIPKRKRII